MLTLENCIETLNPELSTIGVLNKLIFQPAKAYTIDANKQSYFDYGGNRIKKRISGVMKALRAHRFTFSPAKRLSKRVKKKIRDLYISTWSDKMIESWLNDSMNRLLHNWFDSNAYAYRVEGLGLDGCQDKIAHAFQSCRYFVRRDITSFFYTIDHEILLSKLTQIVDKNDYLYELLRQRIQFNYVEEDGTVKKATLGLPFGSALACTLSNIYLTDLDKSMRTFKVNYFRYADDFLLTSTDPDELTRASTFLDSEILKLKLTLKASHTQNLSFEPHPQFQLVNRLSHLGIEYFYAHGEVSRRLALEKQRKIVNLYRKEFSRTRSALKKVETLDGKVDLAIKTANAVVTNRIRSAAIVDYYLKHVNYEPQLKMMDRLITEIVIGAILDKKFRKRDYSTVPSALLYKKGIISLLHRSRLHRHGHLHVNFLSLHNELVIQRFLDMHERRQRRIDHMRIARKIRREDSKI